MSTSSIQDPLKLEIGDGTGFSPQSMMTDHTAEMKFDENDNEDLALPEFEGLWGQSVKEVSVKSENLLFLLFETGAVTLILVESAFFRRFK